MTRTQTIRRSGLLCLQVNAGQQPDLRRVAMSDIRCRQPTPIVQTTQRPSFRACASWGKLHSALYQDLNVAHWAGRANSVAQ